MNLPNKLTVARFFMALTFVGLMAFQCIGTYLAAYVVFILAAITDHYDGKIARERNLITNFGKLLDPVADKVLMAGAFISLMTVPALWVPAWAVVVIITREFLITGVRSLAASGGNVIAANIWGKAKTVFQMVYVFTFLALAIIAQIIRDYLIHVPWIPQILKYYSYALSIASFAAIVIVAAVTVYSGIQFLRVNWHVLNLGKEI
ncbi:MAG: CDP-diacylglycerol--glycerol-3-phosphate 3-phosphatidyltransferase [Candidatus Hydrogenedentes bacterium]|nr:CDP-diacylglycerol--glycerol-3-phosphate 3-phosphatidyltransferase [Candidatus Hydrogenedentota bacterium]